jgi:hypothetical protein
MPVVVFFKAWEHTHPSMLDVNKFDETGAFRIGDIV